MDELKACPFCGSKAEIVEYSDGSGHVECASCGFEALGMFSWGGEKSRKAEAIAAWNRRADDAELSQYKQLIEEAAEEIENCYGWGTELAERLRAALEGAGKTFEPPWYCEDCQAQYDAAVKQCEKCGSTNIAQLPF